MILKAAELMVELKETFYGRAMEQVYRAIAISSHIIKFLATVQEAMNY